MTFCILLRAIPYIWGGEPMAQRELELGDVIKAAREKSDLTVEALAEKVGVTERHLYRIENNEKKPSYELLHKLIRELSITPDSIFYPERLSTDSEVENLIRFLYNCDERSLQVIKATAKALIETASK